MPPSTERRALVTGAGGFLGRNLVRELERDMTVVGADLCPRPEGIGSDWVRIEGDAAGLAESVDRSEPDLVVHAAFLNRKPADWTSEEYLQNQLATHWRFLERCAGRGVPTILISSSAVYGQGTTLDESAPRRPVSLYGVAKTMQELAVDHLAAFGGLSACVVRPFNLIGPGQSYGMLVPDWVRKVSIIADGGEPVLRIPNRATSRDFVDVRDAARAVAMLARDFRPGGVYNLASGRPVSLVELSEELESLCPKPYRTEETHPAPAATDISIQAGDAGKIRRDHGWKPRVGWRQSLADVWADHRSGS